MKTKQLTEIIKDDKIFTKNGSNSDGFVWKLEVFYYRVHNFTIESSDV